MKAPNMMMLLTFKLDLIINDDKRTHFNIEYLDETNYIANLESGIQNLTTYTYKCPTVKIVRGSYGRN